MIIIGLLLVWKINNLIHQFDSGDAVQLSQVEYDNIPNDLTQCRRASNEFEPIFDGDMPITKCF